MELLGEYLKSIRESKNLSLEAVAAKTKISLNYLNAIEESRFDDLPGEVFTKGFLRSYARFLSIDERDIIKRYDDWAMKFKAPEKEIEEVIKKEKKEEIKDRRKIIQIAGTASVIFLAILTVIFLRKEEPVKKADERIDKKPKTEKIVAKENDKRMEGEIASKEGQPLSPDKKNTETPPPQAAQVKKEKNSLNLVIKATELSWLAVTIDNKDKKDMLLQPKEKISLKAEESFLLTIGNAGGVEIEFNGKRLDPFGPKGRVVTNILLTKEKINR